MASEQDLAGEVTKKILSNGSIVINLYVASLLLLGSGPITLYHLLGIVLLLITTIASISFATTFRNNSYYLINQCAILVLPIFMEAYISKSWISYGLLIAIFVLFSATYESTIIFILCILSAVIVQYWVAAQSFIGIIDNQDLLLLNSYFSSTWVLIAGIGVRVARLIYLNYCKQIDDQLFSLQDQIYDSKVRQSSLNLKDHINLAIHGTLLNTCISYNQMPDKARKQKELAKDIETDLINIKALTTSKVQVNFESQVRKMLVEQGHTVEFNSNNFRSDLKLIGDPIIEVIREIGLNTKKHSNSRNFKIDMVEKIDFLQIMLTEIFPNKLDSESVELKLIGANSSVSLLRIVKSSKFGLKISADDKKESLKYILSIPKILQPAEAISQINVLRRKSLTRNVELLTLISVFYSVLAIVGFALLNVPILVEILVGLANLLIFYDLWTKQQSKPRLLIAQFCLLLIIPYIIFLNDTCRNLLYTPWLFNAIFGALLYAISVTNNPFLKWGPGILFILENLATKLYFPQECKTLLDGSTPGFAFLLIFGYLMARLRVRNTRLDETLELSIQATLESNVELRNYTALAREELITNLEGWNFNLKNSIENERDFEKSLLIAIQKIKAFLICSQHFESLLIKDIYNAISLRLNKNKPINISILSDPEKLSGLRTETDLIKSIGFLSNDQCDLIIKVDKSVSAELYEGSVKVFEIELTQ